MVMVHVHCPWERGRTRKNCVDCGLAGESEDEREDQRSKRARLLTRFQKGDIEGRRDHFHFDQKFSSKTQKTKMKMLVAKSDRIKKLGVLNRESPNTDTRTPAVRSFLRLFFVADGWRECCRSLCSFCASLCFLSVVVIIRRL